MISKYNEFLLEKEFQSLIDEMYRIVESEGRWTSDNTYEWDLSDEYKDDDYQPDWLDRLLDKAEDFIRKIPKDRIKEYFVRLVNATKSIPEIFRKRLIAGYLSIFLAVVSFGYLMSPNTSTEETQKVEQIDPTIKKNIEEVHQKIENKEQKASFEEAQKLVKTAEAGYSNDRGDTGNYIDVPGGKRFIGTNHGISAPILDEYFKSQGIKRLLTKDDMINLSYQTALKIYKSDYWDAQHLGELSDQSVANIIYDGCVNQGSDAMRSIVRDALEENGVKISNNDVIFSKEVLSKANQVNQVKLFNSIKKFRELRYKESDTFDRHGEGWLNRLDNISYTPQETTSNRA